MAKDDGELWREVAGSVTPLRGRTVPPPLPMPQKTKTQAKKPETASETQTKSPRVPVKQRKQFPANLDGESFGGISAADAKRLTSGQTRILATLDLHGMTLTEARGRLTRFIIANRGNRARTVLVITGKGRDGRGVIREHLPRWCAEADIAPHVIAFCKAMPRDGGTGAFYLRLRAAQSP